MSGCGEALHFKTLTFFGNKGENYKSVTTTHHPLFTEKRPCFPLWAQGVVLHFNSFSFPNYLKALKESTFCQKVTNQGLSGCGDNLILFPKENTSFKFTKIPSAPFLQSTNQNPLDRGGKLIIFAKENKKC